MHKTLHVPLPLEPMVAARIHHRCVSACSSPLFNSNLGLDNLAAEALKILKWQVTKITMNFNDGQFW